MKFEEIEEKVSSYRWLKGIADNYQKMIDLMEREQDYFRLYKMQYAARGDLQVFDINPHRSIPVKYLQDGLREALKGIDQELAQLKSELKEWNIEV